MDFFKFFFFSINLPPNLISHFSHLKTVIFPTPDFNAHAPSVHQIFVNFSDELLLSSLFQPAGQANQDPTDAIMSCTSSTFAAGENPSLFSVETDWVRKRANLPQMTL